MARKKHAPKTRPNYNLDITIEHLVRAFDRSPTNDPDICVEALSRMVKDVLFSPEKEFVRVSQPPYKKFWICLFKFVVFPRDSAQIHTLSTRLSLCNCSAELSKVHGASPPMHITPSNFLLKPWSELPKFDQAMLCVIALLWRRIESSNTASVSKGSSENWPRCPSDLLLVDPAVVCQSLVQWTRTLNSLLPIGILGHIMDICRDLVFPAISQSTTLGPCFLEAPWTLCRTLVRSLSDDKDGLLKMFFFELQHLNKFYNVFYWHSTPTFLPLVKEKEINLLQQISLILHIKSRYGVFRSIEAEAAMIEGVCRMGNDLIHRLPICKLPRYQHYTILGCHKRSEDPTEEELTDYAYTRAYTSIKFAKDQNKCHANGCTKSLATIGSSLRRCARCRITTYCSRECQQSSWDASQRPHKAICRKIVQMLDYGGGLKVDSDDFVSNCIRGGVSKLAADLVANYAPKWDKYERLPNPENLTGEGDYEELVRIVYGKADPLVNSVD